MSHKDSIITHICGTQYSIVLSLCLSCNDMVTRMKVKVQARKPNWREMSKESNTLALSEDAGQGCLTNGYRLPINVLNRHVFYVSFLGRELSGPKWVSPMGG